MLGPLVLIVVGVIALLVETNKLNAIHLWDWYIRWWPLLLIGVGLLSLGEWWLDRASRGNIGRRSHGGLVALIICLAVLGYVVGCTTHGLHGMHLVRAWRGRRRFLLPLVGPGARCRPQPEPADPGRRSGRYPGASWRRDRDSFGRRSDPCAGAPGGVCRQRQGCPARLDALAPQLAVNGKNVTLRAADENDGRADLTIEIPNGTVPTVTAGHGDVTLEGLAGDATWPRPRATSKPTTSPAGST